MSDDEPTLELTPSEVAQLRQFQNYNWNPSQQGYNQFRLFKDIVESDDTTKTGNLDINELGEPDYTLRTLKDLEILTSNLFLQPQWGNIFRGLGENLTSTSLSKDAKLLNLTVLSKQQVEAIKRSRKKPSGGWFGRKDKSETTEGE